MTIDTDVNPQKRFVPAFLPWLLAVGAFIFYLATLNHWVSFTSLPHVAQTSGWTWQPELAHPLYWLLTRPFCLLPAKLIPVALNVFSAACAVLVLALLARSVALLPHDRTEDQRSRERGAFGILSIRSAWIPPFIAVLLCGLQLSFWENATAASSDMLDLLLFAYVIRCLLEFRIAETQGWLSRASFVYGLGMTGNWAMIGFLPIFLAAVIWIKGLSFFNLRFLSRMSLWAVAGLSLYLLLPLVNNAADIGRVAFWDALQLNLKNQKFYLASLPFSKLNLFTSDQPLWVLGIFSLLPLLVMSVSWPSYFGDPSRLGVALTKLILHFFHAVLLLICVWLTLDPQFSPRHYALLAANGCPGLPIYYLAILGIGYFTGYFLLIFGTKPSRQQRPEPFLLRLLNRFIFRATLLLFLAPAILVYRNLPQIHLTNGPMLKDYSALVAQNLPPQGAILLSDDSSRLALAHSAAVQIGRQKQYLFVDTQLLPSPDYHRFLAKKYPQAWPYNPPKTEQRRVVDLSLLGLMTALAKSNNIYYLHPSFGYYFEVFYPEPHGLVYKLNPYPTNSVFEVLPTKELLDENEVFWLKADDSQLRSLAATLAPAAPNEKPGFLDRVVQLAHLKKEQNSNASMLGAFYSRALDFWGVQLQRTGHLPQAGTLFTRAVELNADNVVAKANLDFNQDLRAGKRPPVEFSKSIEDRFGKYRNWELVMRANGPFDDPTLCFAQGIVYSHGGLYRQAAREFARVKTLAPDYLPARLLLAQLYFLSALPEQALAETADIHAHAEQLGLNAANTLDLLSIELSSHLALNQLSDAEAVVRSAASDSPDPTNVLALATRTYINAADRARAQAKPDDFQKPLFTNALTLIERQLKLTPDDTSALINKGYVCLQLKTYDQAIPPLDRALELQTTNSLAMFNRAIACLGAERLDDAQRDYETLQKLFPASYQVQYGLGEVAFRKKQTNEAIRYYQLYLGNAPTNSPTLTNEVVRVRSHLKELQSASP